MVTPAIDDAEIAALLERCGRGDRVALEALYRAASSRLLGCLLRILRRRALAEEALQDVFLQIWQRAAQYEEHRGRAYAWMVSIARYRAIDILRRERAVATDPFELAETLTSFETQSASSSLPAEAHLPMNDAAALMTCLGQLNTEQRESIQLAFLSGRSHPEIAAAMQRPLGSVKSWIRRGLMSLKECLESCNARNTT